MKLSVPFDSKPPAIAVVQDGVHRPLWSVMIPTFNCAKYLRQTLESVLAQDQGSDQMQIEVVDDYSTTDEPKTVVEEVGKGRVAFHRKPKNEGAIANFNTCIQRSRGHLLHILHGDDYVLPGFYQRLTEEAQLHPDVSLVAVRAFHVDEEGVILAVGPRLPKLENGSHLIEDFFYETPIQFPGIVVRRDFYEKNGGFIPALVHTADCEMWARATGLAGGLVTREVLACYRLFAGNDSGRLARTGENLRDCDRLNQLFAERYPEFDCKRGRQRVLDTALSQARRFSETGDSEAAKVSQDYWKENAPVSLRSRRFAKIIAKSILR
jgi:glycosyltransferase involved in cell wall biosynthesis